jgi:phenylpropionate dioxygenase-like ring-hydroxylating dioxygenase large terminal subunit
MLVTKQKILRRFWYPILPAERLADGPKGFRLLGEDIVLWRDAARVAHAAQDRCCHRTSKLSPGWVDGDLIVCPYHGWAYDGTGACKRIPQAKDQTRAIKFSIPAYRTEERYGYVWVALEEPLFGVPEFEEHDAPGWRTIHQFYEPWKAAGLRVMENSFDWAHFSFVHRATFGDQEQPDPAKSQIDEHPWGFVARTVAPVVNRGDAAKITGVEGTRTERHMTAHWYMPFARKLHIAYPSGTHHSIVTIATPIDDGTSQICQWVYRNDTEAQVKAADAIAFDRQITGEDKAILEATDPDVPLDRASGIEFHMPSDRPGLIMRDMLRGLLAAHGETEVRRDGEFPSGSARAAE